MCIRLRQRLRVKLMGTCLYLGKMSTLIERSNRYYERYKEDLFCRDNNNMLGELLLLMYGKQIWPIADAASIARE